MLLVRQARVRRHELVEQLGVLVVRPDGHSVPARAEDAHGGLAVVRVGGEGLGAAITTFLLLLLVCFVEEQWPVL